MSEETENVLRRWRHSESDILDDAHRHFDDENIWYDIDVGREGVRLYEIMFNEKVEALVSPVYALFSGVACAASAGVWAAVAVMLGIDQKALESVAADWYERQDDHPAAIDYAELLRRLHEFELLRARLHEERSEGETA